MMKQPTVRPARAAIAAVLAVASTPLMAQVAAPAAPPPVTATQAPAPMVAAPPVVTPSAPVAAPAAAVPVMAAPSPVVQPTPPPGPAPVVAEAAPEATPAPRTERVRAAPLRTVAARTETVAPRVAALASTEVTPAPVAASAPTAAPVVDRTTATEDATTAAPVEATTANGGNGLEWGLIGGGVVLLGGLGLMAMRRRRPSGNHAEAELLVGEPAVRYAPAVTAREPAIAAPSVADAYHYERSGAPQTVHGRSLESMVAAAPSSENPFLTRKNRLRRAHFILRQQEAPAHYASPTVKAASVAQAERRPSPVYDFGGGIQRRRGFRPATT